jgi:hypothetical protein
LRSISGVDSSYSTDLDKDLLGIDCSQGCSQKFRYEKMLDTTATS